MLLHLNTEVTHGHTHIRVKTQHRNQKKKKYKFHTFGISHASSEKQFFPGITIETLSVSFRNGKQN